MVSLYVKERPPSRSPYVCVYVCMCILSLWYESKRETTTEMPVCMCVSVYVCMCVRAYVCMCECVNLRMCECVNVWMCVCVYVCMCVCVYVYGIYDMNVIKTYVLCKRNLSVWQCGAVWCSVVQCVAVWCSVLQCVAVYCSHTRGSMHCNETKVD